ncbi:hypothetical protein [Streptomyces sp. NPDC058755]|uniref:hypothetical protein n=1 Tax=Streptomyces sp. NPDC058755 TaxID=3346624 RepID=UPI0036989E3A
MLMDKVESALVDSGPRRVLQRFYEAPLLTRLDGRIPGGPALEIGCGSGYGIRLILDRFGAPARTSSPPATSSPSCHPAG